VRHFEQELENLKSKLLEMSALVESAVGLANLPDILATAGVVAVAFGSVDFSLDLDCAHDRLTLLAARNEIVWRSRAAGRAAPIDGVTTDLSSPEITEDDARHAMKMGFGGKMAIHPRQIEPIRSAFHPSENQIAWANDIVGAASLGEAVQAGDPLFELRYRQGTTLGAALEEVKNACRIEDAPPAVPAP